ncbi:MAG: glycine--tRNA ligase [Candidatus Alkanophagales archaeon]
MTAARKEDEVMELARRRGFIWAAFEIYGGASGFFDYGPLGAALKRKIENLWREFYTLGEGFYEIETTTIGIRDVFDASGHLACFMDKMVECKRCRSLFRADHVGGRCPDCGGELSEPQDFNLMFKTRIGAVTGAEGGERGRGEAYLRPETAQGMFVNFPRLLRFHRNKLPFGIIQIGRAYRNEISPRQGIIRLREFTLAEAEVFVLPHEKNKHPRFHEVEGVVMRLKPNYTDEEIEITVGEAVERKIIAHEYLGYHMARVQQFLEKIGIPVGRLRFRQHGRDEMAHYAEDCWDAEFLSERFGWVEIVGIADRGDYDLSAHSRKAKVDMSVPVAAEDAPEGAETKERVFPHVIEPSYGIDRIVYALLESSFHKEEVRGEVRRVLRFKRCVAPVEVAVLPLLNRKELVDKAREVFRLVRSHGIFAEYDASGSIGRRYRRQDEIGTPYCITIDYETLENDTVTIRDRDSMRQVRVRIAELPAKLKGDVESMFG